MKQGGNRLRQENSRYAAGSGKDWTVFTGGNISPKPGEKRQF